MAECLLYGQSGRKPKVVVPLGSITGNRTSNTVVTFDLSNYVTSSGLSVNNFIVQWTQIQKITTAYACTLSYTYNSTTKVLTCTSNNNMFASGGSGFAADIWLIEN